MKITNTNKILWLIIFWLLISVIRFAYSDIDKNKVNIGHIMAFVTICFWGVTFVSTKILLSYFTPIEILACRFLMAYFLLFILYPRIKKIKSLKEEILFFFLGLFGICTYYLLENIALKHTLVSNVGFYMSATPIITSLLASVISQFST